MLKDKIVTLGITSSIAAYKVPELIRLLQKKGAIVRTIITPKAQRFIATGLLEALTQHKVYIEEDLTEGAKHIELAQTSDLFIIVPLSANTLNKFADGITDNVLTTTILATRKPVLICPAMNTGMWENQILQKNLQKLLQLPNFTLVKPTQGELFCKAEGLGRLAEIKIIALEAQKIFTPQILENKNILISLGSTREKIDPVRFISNYSSGKTGYALAKTAYLMGANVVVIAGYAEINEPVPFQTIKVKTTLEMLTAVKDNLENQKIFISVAGVSDFQTNYQKQKIKSGNSLKLKLKPNPDILKEVSKIKTAEQIIIGFALESENLEKNAKQKLKKKKLDYIIANRIENIGTETGSYLLMSQKKTEEIEKIQKEDFGFKIWREVI